MKKKTILIIVWIILSVIFSCITISQASQSQMEESGKQWSMIWGGTIAAIVAYKTHKKLKDKLITDNKRTAIVIVTFIVSLALCALLSRLPYANIVFFVLSSFVAGAVCVGIWMILFGGM